MPIPQTVSSGYNAINPLVGLSSTALRLYRALEVFRDVFHSRNEWEWFRAPRLDKRLQPLGFSKQEINQELAALVRAGMLQTRDAGNIRWYQLK